MRQTGLNRYPCEESAIRCHVIYLSPPHTPSRCIELAWRLFRRGKAVGDILHSHGKRLGDVVMQDCRFEKVALDGLAEERRIGEWRKAAAA